MGTIFVRHQAVTRWASKNFSKMMNKTSTTLFFILALLVASEALPAPQFFGINLNQESAKQHGTQKALIGAGLFGLGAITGNQGLQDTGAAIGALGLGTKLGAHILPSSGR